VLTENRRTFIINPLLFNSTFSVGLLFIKDQTIKQFREDKREEDGLNVSFVTYQETTNAYKCGSWWITVNNSSTLICKLTSHTQTSPPPTHTHTSLAVVSSLRSCKRPLTWTTRHTSIDRRVSSGRETDDLHSSPIRRLYHPYN
jgi:hypothetical protein